MKKFACIFGASGEIGQAIALEMSKQGWSLYLHFHENKNAVENLQKNLQKLYPSQELHTIQANLGELNSVNDIVEQLFEVQVIVLLPGKHFINC